MKYIGLLVTLLVLACMLIGCDTADEGAKTFAPLEAPGAPALVHRVVEMDVSFQDVFSPRDVPALRLDWREYWKGGVEGVHIVLYVQDRNGTRYSNHPVRMVKDPNVHVWQTPSTYTYLGDTVYVSDARGVVSLWAKLRVGDQGTLAFDVGRAVFEVDLPQQ